MRASMRWGILFLVAALAGYWAMRALRSDPPREPVVDIAFPQEPQIPAPPSHLDTRAVTIRGPATHPRVEQAVRNAAAPLVRTAAEYREALAELDALLARAVQPNLPDGFFVDFREDLFQLLRRYPWLAGEIPARFLTLHDDRALFAVAQASNLFIGGHEQAWIDMLEQANEQHRALGLYAFMGRQEQILREFIFRAYVDDPAPRVRETATFLIPEVILQLEPPRREAAYEQARRYLTAQESERLKEHALDILVTRRPLAPADADLAARTWQQALTPQLKMAAVRTLLDGGAPARARLLLQSMAADATLPEHYRQAAQQLLQTLP